MWTFENGRLMLCSLVFVTDVVFGLACDKYCIGQVKIGFGFKGWLFTHTLSVTGSLIFVLTTCTKPRLTIMIQYWMTEHNKKLTKSTTVNIYTHTTDCMHRQYSSNSNNNPISYMTMVVKKKTFGQDFMSNLKF